MKQIHKYISKDEGKFQKYRTRIGFKNKMEGETLGITAYCLEEMPGVGTGNDTPSIF